MISILNSYLWLFLPWHHPITTRRIFVQAFSSKKTLLISKSHSCHYSSMSTTSLTVSGEDQDHTSDDIKKGCIYITIGPQASGKTTLLSKLLSNTSKPSNDTPSSDSIQEVADVTIDDQLGVYHKVPMALFFCDPFHPNIDLKPYEPVLNTPSFGKLLGQRIFAEEHDEMRWVIQRITGRISASDFKHKIQILSQKQQDTRKRYYLLLSHQDGKEDLDSEKDWTEIFIQTVELWMENQRRSSNLMMMTKTADIFISEAIFKALHIQGENVQQSALNRAIFKLHSLASDPLLLDPKACLSWGNTNTRPNDYVTALEAAVVSNRPIDFIPFANPEKVPGIACGIYLPYVGLEELFRRNVQRFITTGRYIPARAIIDTCLRVNILMNDARTKIIEHKCRPMESVDTKADSVERTSNVWKKLDWNRAFAALAGYEMLDDGTVQKMDVKRRIREDEETVDRTDTKRAKTI